MNNLIQGQTLCTAHKRNGDPCGNRPMAGTTVCRMHGGAAPQVRARAQQRLDEASDIAVRRILAIMNDGKVPVNVRLMAARDVLDRAKIAGVQQVEVKAEVQSWEQKLTQVVVDWGAIPDPDATAAPLVVPITSTDPEAERDEESRLREQQRARRKRNGQPLSLPSERPTDPAMRTEVPAWSAPTPLTTTDDEWRKAGRERGLRPKSGLKPLRTKRTQP